MNSRFHSCIRSGLVALGVLAGLCVPAAATPLAGVSRAAAAPAVADASSDIVSVNHRRYRCYDGWCGQKYGRSHLKYRYWDDDWRYRRHHRRHIRRHVYPGFYLGLGVPTYRYVQPRRYYGGGSSSAHVAWCYDRYRSYRAWDNTYQPYHGPRRQCWSPFS
jgi:hypothetical protein